MNASILLIGDGPFANHLAKNFKQHGFSIIMTTIKEENISTIRLNGYIPIYSGNLHKDGCTKIYDQAITILNDYSLDLKYIIHTARSSFYEPDEKDPPDEVKSEMLEVNSKSPERLARHFSNIECQFIFISSCATEGFNKNLFCHATPNNKDKKIGTTGVKYYSYTKRLGEENIYRFFKEINRLSSLTISRITAMLGTDFFKDMGIPDPDIKGYMNAEQTANYIAHKILQGQRRIYPGWQAKVMSILPSAVNAIILDSTRFFK